MRLEITAGDTEPLELDLTDDNQDATFTSGDTVVFFMAPAPQSGQTDPRIDGKDATLNGSIARYEWADGETDWPGVYEAQFLVHRADGTSTTYPDEPIDIVIQRRAGMKAAAPVTSSSVAAGAGGGTTPGHMIGSTRKTVSSTPVLLAQNSAPIFSPDSASLSFALKNLTATADVLLDGVNFDAAEAWPWTAQTDGPMIVTLEPGEQLWGQSAGVDQVVAVLGTGR